MKTIGRKAVRNILKQAAAATHNKLMKEYLLGEPTMEDAVRDAWYVAQKKGHPASNLEAVVASYALAAAENVVLSVSQATPNIPRLPRPL